jgi:histidinol dehydrogenase
LPDYKDAVMRIGAVADHRSREGGAVIYPVYSRRSGGLSVGVNLFPDRKVCSFNCPYCEVFPFETDIRFSLDLMKGALRSALREAETRRIPVRDICFSGNGEPSLAPGFFRALHEARKIRDERAPEARLVLITNGTALLDPPLFALLQEGSMPDSKTGNGGLEIWLKLDAATEAWYTVIDRSAVPHGTLIDRIREFAASGAAFTLQTMLCKVAGRLPPETETAAWISLAVDLAVLSVLPRREKPGLRGVQIYGKARPAPEDPLAQAAPPEALEERAALLRAELALRPGAPAIPVAVYP